MERGGVHSGKTAKKLPQSPVHNLFSAGKYKKNKVDKTVLDIENEITAFVCVLALQPFSQMDAVIESNQIPTCVSYRKRSKANWLAGYIYIYLMYIRKVTVFLSFRSIWRWWLLRTQSSRQLPV